jgi:predicted unusual protein kinase regulating ubiquinone biosynthesis (AarF/ABC1/UbiB family)
MSGWLVLTAAVGVGGALVLVRHRGLRGRLRRTGGTVGLASRTAVRWVSHRLRATGQEAAERERLHAMFHLRTAEDVAATMGAMKGAMMKLAQMLSYVDSGLPPAYQQVLAQLQENAPPMTYELAAGVIRDELGKPPGQAYAWFDPEPLAAASIGQVHAARTHDGRAVVVKVQYPGVADAMRADLDNVDLLYRMMGPMFPNLDPKPLVAEIRDRLLEELDYRIELQNQQRFLTLYRAHPFIRIPEVVPELCGRRVLTMEHLDGLPWSDALQAPADIRNVWGEVIYRFVFGTLYRDRLFNGDPHPGNYRFFADGSVGFLDFGCVKTFTAAELTNIKTVVLTAIGGDAGQLRTELVRQGFLAADDTTEATRILEWFQIFYRGALRREPFTFSRQFAETAVRANIDPSSEWAPLQKHFNMPPSYVMLTRINLGLLSVLGGLEARQIWRNIADEFWHAAPGATALGELDAAFRARCHRED